MYVALSFAVRQLKHKKKIKDSWTHDGRIKSEQHTIE